MTPLGSYQSLELVDDGIIDLTQYLNRRGEEQDPPRSTFALFGADGERARFALPLWRAIYLATGDRGGVVWRGEGEDRLRSMVVLDLAEDPPRTEFDLRAVEGLEGDDPPVVMDRVSEGMAVFLGLEDGRRWYVVIDGTSERTAPIADRDREDILFLAGECAGLLFLRGFAAGVE